MARSFLDIANKALYLIGHKTIQDLEADDNVSGRCKVNLYDSIDEVLREHDWNCARERLSIAPMTTAPAFGFTNQFQLPTNPFCLRPLQLYGTSSTWKVEGRHLLCDDSSIKLIFTKRITDPNDFDALCAEAIAVKLAMKLSYSFTKEVTQGQKLQQIYADVLERAMAIDSQEGDYDDPVDLDLEDY